jgi:hypothetical protein
VIDTYINILQEPFYLDFCARKAFLYKNGKLLSDDIEIKYINNKITYIEITFNNEISPTLYNGTFINTIQIHTVFFPKNGSYIIHNNKVLGFVFDYTKTDGVEHAYLCWE